MPWWIWVVAGFLLLAVEMASTTLHVGFFGAGAFFVALLLGFGWEGPLFQQLLVFTAFSLVALFLIRPPLMRRLRLNEPRVVDSLIGELATAIDEIAVQSRGKAELRGTTWTAMNVGNRPVSPGQRCRVERVEGLLLYINPQ